MLDKFKTSPSSKLLYTVLICAIIPFIIISVLFQLDNALMSALSPYNILHFEFAFDQATAQIILADWQSNSLIPLILYNTYLDFAYIAAYGLALMAANILVTRSLSDRCYNLGIICALAPLVAGVLDVVENINLITMLNDPVGFPAYAPTIASISAGIKFGLLFLALGFLLLGLVILLIRKFSHSSED